MLKAGESLVFRVVVTEEELVMPDMVLHSYLS